MFKFAISNPVYKGFDEVL